METLGLNEWANRIFTSSSGDYGLISIIQDQDNEIKFQMLMSFLVAGLQIMGKSTPDLSSNELVQEINQRLMYIGYKLDVTIVPYSEGKMVIHYCSIGQNQQMLMNRFHPFRLMDGMSVIPNSYTDFFKKKEYLHQVIAVVRCANTILKLSFNHVTVHIVQNVSVDVIFEPDSDNSDNDDNGSTLNQFESDSDSDSEDQLDSQIR